MVDLDHVMVLPTIPFPGCTDTAHRARLGPWLLLCPALPCHAYSGHRAQGTGRRGQATTPTRPGPARLGSRLLQAHAPSTCMGSFGGGRHDSRLSREKNSTTQHICETKEKQVCTSTSAACVSNKCPFLSVSIHHSCKERRQCISDGEISHGEFGLHFCDV